MKNNPLNTLKDKRVLITGGTGFIGSSLAPKIKSLCREAHIYEEDIRKIAGFKKRYDVVCHLAALNKPEDKKGEIVEMFDVNVGGTLAVMRYCHKNSARCIFASSSAVYKPSASGTAIEEGALLRPIGLYGASKVLAEDVCRAYSEDFGISVMALRIFNIYGPGQKEPFLIPYLINRMKNGEKIKLNTPKAVRDFVYVSDAVSAFISALVHTWQGFKALNVGTGHGTSIYDAAQKTARMMSFRPDLDGAATNSHKTDYVVSSVRNICDVLGWKPVVTLEKGLKILCKTDQ